MKGKLPDKKSIIKYVGGLVLAVLVVCISVAFEKVFMILLKKCFGRMQKG